MKKIYFWIPWISILFGLHGCIWENEFLYQSKKYIQNKYHCKIKNFQATKVDENKDYVSIKYKAEVIFIEGYKTECLLKYNPGYSGPTVIIGKGKRVISNRNCIMKIPREIGEKATIQGVIGFRKQNLKWLIYSHMDLTSE
jgi:hypothetical protein